MARRPTQSGPGLFDLDSPAPTIAQTRVAPVEALAPAEPSYKNPPTYREHLCSADGCYAWGSFGMFDGNISTSKWWCRSHVPPGFLPKDRAE